MDSVRTDGGGLEALRFAGLTGPSSSGATYDLLRDRFDGYYAIPRSRTGRALSRRFADVFPALRWLPRLLRPMPGSEPVRLSAETLAELVEAMWERGSKVALPAFRIGVPGAYRKIVAALPVASGREWCFGKLPAHDGGIPPIARETDVLRRLAECDSLDGLHPRVIGFTTFRDRPLLVLSGGPTAAARRRLGRTHREFLDRLYGATGRKSSFGRSSIWERWTSDLTLLDTDPRWQRARETLSRAADRVTDRLAGREVTLCMAHGDFVPWNTRALPNSIYAFDWEKALDESIPGHDAFHFEIVPRVLRGRGISPPRVAMRLARRRTMDFGIDAETAYLGFLVETGLHYAAARVRCPDQGEDRIAATMVETAERCLRDGI